MKHLSNADVTVLYQRRSFLQSLIRDLIPEHRRRGGASSTRRLVDQINAIRGEVREIVEDPEFDTLVSVAVFADQFSVGRKREETVTNATLTAQELLNYIDVILATTSSSKLSELQQGQAVAGNIFIGHGRNELIRHKIKDFIRDRCRLNPLVLEELPSASMTIIEKLEKYGRTADYAVFLLTGDDIVGEETRARQNVIHEVGWFQGALGRNRTAMLVQTGVELFSNISGVVYLEFSDNTVESVFELLRRELEEAGLL